MPATQNLVELRQLLANRFPRVRMNAAPSAPVATRPTGVSALDAALGGGLPRGEFTELVAPPQSAGSAQVLHAWLRRVADDGEFLALVDGRDSFDVSAVEPDVLARLLWVRCGSAAEALKATDWLLRDRNFAAVALDLKLNPAAELRAISSSVWHRFARLLEQNPTTVLAVTPFPLISVAAARVQLDSALTVEALSASPARVLDALRFTLLRSTAVAGETAAAG